MLDFDDSDFGIYFSFDLLSDSWLIFFEYFYDIRYLVSDLKFSDLLQL